jgi:hypothetical protein
MKNTKTYENFNSGNIGGEYKMVITDSEDHDKLVEPYEGGFRVKTIDGVRPYWAKIGKNNEYKDIIFKSKEEATNFSKANNKKTNEEENGPKGPKELVALSDGHIQIYSGSDARSAEVKIGNILEVTEENEHFYIGKLLLQGHGFQKTPGLSGKRFDPYSVDHKTVLFALRKSDVKNDYSGPTEEPTAPFFSVFKEKTNESMNTNEGDLYNFQGMRKEDKKKMKNIKDYKEFHKDAKSMEEPGEVKIKNDNLKESEIEEASDYWTRVVMPEDDWDTLKTALESDAEAKWIDGNIKDDIKAALGRLKSKTVHGNTFILCPSKEWNDLTETLSMDMDSNNIDDAIKAEISKALENVKHISKEEYEKGKA